MNEKKNPLTILLSLISICLFSFNLFSQETTSWYGELNMSSTTLPITLKIEEKADTTIILMGSPSQTNQMFSVTKQRFTQDSILFSMKSLNVVFKGKYNSTKDTIFASFKQGLLQENLIMVKTKELFETKRPQEPQPPYPYIEQELSFKVEGVNYDFKGTLTLPSIQGTYPCVILVTGSGLQNRDEELMNHKPFKVIADYLTRNNIAVFRYDDRGWNGDITDSTINNATTLDYAVDAQAAFDMIKTHPNINPKQIGMLGHSEGGVITSIAASKNPNISFVILLASTGQKGIDVLLQQNEVILKNIKMPKHAVKMQLSALKQIYKYIEKDYTSDEIEKRMNLWFDKELSKLNAGQRKESPFATAMERTKFINQLSSNWMQCFLKLNPYDYLTKVNQPTFALNGTNDVQVLQEYNLPQIEKALKKAKNKNYKTYKAIGHNHLFQQCTTGMIDEYSKIEQTISPIILEQIKEFIKSTTK